MHLSLRKTTLKRKETQRLLFLIRQSKKKKLVGNAKFAESQKATFVYYKNDETIFWTVTFVSTKS